MDRSTEAPGGVLLRLYAEEVRALPRGRFALPGAAVLFLLLAAFAAGPAVFMAGGLWGFGFFAFVLVPCLFAGVVAARVAGARASLFVHGVFTMPVTQAQFLVASVLASLTLAGAYVVATLPFVAVIVLHLEDPGVLLRFLATGVGLLTFATAVGTLLGVLFTRRGVSAAVALAAGVMVLATLGIGYVTMLVGGPGGSDAHAMALRVAHVSPVVLLLSATDLYAHGFSNDAPVRALTAFGVLTLGVIALAAWAFVREQGVESWESPPRRRALLALALVTVVLSPAVVADPEYETGPKRVGLSVGQSHHGMDAALAPRGGDAWEARRADHFDRSRNLVAGETHARDLVMWWGSTEHWAEITNVRVTIEAPAALNLEGPTELHFATLPTNETVTVPAVRGPYPRDAFEAHIVRIPLEMTPTPVDVLAWNLYYVHVNVTFDAAPKADAPPEYAGRSGPMTSSALIPVLADVSDASAKMALAGAPALVACVAGAVIRARRTR